MSDSNPIPLEPGETDEAYRAWCDYRDMGAGSERSIRKLIEQYEQRIVRLYAEQQSVNFDTALRQYQANAQAVKKSLYADPRYKGMMPPSTRRTTLEHWSSTYKWGVRAAKVEVWLEEQRLDGLKDKQKEIIQEALADYDLQLKEFREVFANTKMHKRRVKKRVVRDEVDDQGRPIRVEELATIVEINTGDFMALAAWREKIDVLGRRAVGLPSSIADTKLANDPGTTTKRPVNVILPPGYTPPDTSGDDTPPEE